MNGEIPGPEEIPNNGLDDDCNPETADACDDDEFDGVAPNGSFENATPVADGNTRAVQYGGLQLCTNDKDWYIIEVPQDSGLEVDLFFDHEDGDLDVRLHRLTDGQTNFVASGFSVSDNETVYVQRADAPSTYLIEIFTFGQAARIPYGMSVNVFNDCIDDAIGLGGEQNDDAGAAASFPQVREQRQICDYDDDFYTFTLDEARQTRIDLIFTDADGDLDMTLESEALPNPILSWGVRDNEVIEEELPAGVYTVRISGVGDDQNQYRLFRTSGAIDTIRASMEGDNRPIPDYVGGANGEAGLLDVDLPVDAPAGSIIRSLTIRTLDIDHSFLRDLRVSAHWDGIERAVVWDREGDFDGTDGNNDDDALELGGGNDITIEDREYPGFIGLPADGQFTLRIEDMAAVDEGEITELEISVEYLVP